MRGDKENYPYPLISLILAVILVLMMVNMALADDDSDSDSDDPAPTETSSLAEAAADALASAEATATGGSATARGGNASATGGVGGNVDLAISTPRQAPDTFLYMQNQVEACGRTFGVSGSNTSGSWTFGLPIPRSWTPTCDLWKAANEAQENGFVHLSYTFQCSIKAVRKVLGDTRCAYFEEQSLIELGLIGAHKADDQFDHAALIQEHETEEIRHQEQLMIQQQQIELLSEELSSTKNELDEFKDTRQRIIRDFSRRQAEDRQYAADALKRLETY